MRGKFITRHFSPREENELKESECIARCTVKRAKDSRRYLLPDTSITKAKRDKI